MSPHRDLLAVAGEAVDAGAEWLARAGSEWSTRRLKASGEEVTDADVEVERRVCRVLHARTPGVPVVGEESGESGESERTAAGVPLPSRCWLLDPIDGTMNFTRGAPLYAISLAYVENGEPSLGVIHAPALGRRWSTDAVSGPPEEPSGARRVSRAVVGLTGLGSGGSRSRPFVGLLQERAYRIRMQGSMSLDLVGVAEGWLDACLCVVPKPWDVAAGTALLRRRGRTVLGAGGEEFTLGSPVLAAGREDLARALLALWESGPAEGG